MLLWIIVLVLIILAVGGGVAVSNLLWLLLVIALVVAVVALLSGRRRALRASQTSTARGTGAQAAHARARGGGFRSCDRYEWLLGGRGVPRELGADASAQLPFPPPGGAA